MKLKSSGYSLLEFVITIPVTFLFLLGVTDVMRAISAQTAVDSATETALRCLSPVNGACQNEVKDSYVKKFDVYKLNKIDKYIADGYTFDATSNSVNVKVHTSQANATILDKGYVELQPYSMYYKELAYSADFVSKYYLMTKSLPMVTGDAANLDSQQFVLKNNQKVSYSPTLTILGNNTRNNAGNNTINDKFSLNVSQNGSGGASHTISFRIPRPYDCNDDIPCFISDNIDSINAQNNNNFTKNCSAAFSWKNESKFGANGEITYKEYTGKGLVCHTTPILLFISGTKSIQGRDEAKVTIQLFDNDGLVRDLGGRLFNKNSSATFVARGAKPDLDNYSQSLLENYQEKELTYHQAIQLDYDKDYQIKFTITRTDKYHDGAIKWTFNQLNIFTPEYKLKTLRVECKNPIFLSENKRKKFKKCSIKNVDTSKFKDYDFETHGTGIKSDDGLEVKGDCSLEKDGLIPALIARNIDKNLDKNFYEYKTESCGQRKTVEVPCSKNYGTKNPKEYAKVCNIDVDKIDYDYKDIFKPVISSKFDMKTIDLGEKSWKKENCNDNKEYLPNEWRNYEVLNITDKNVQYEPVNLNATECNEDTLKNYNCSEFTVTKNVIKPDSNDYNQSKSLLVGKHEGMQCSWKNGGWKEILTNEIVSYYPEYKTSCFNLNIHKSGKKILDNPPSDECVTYSLSSLHSDEGRDSAPIAKDVKENEIPDVCKTSTNICEFVFTGYEKVDDSGNLDKNFDKASILASNKIKQLMPVSQANCDGNYCVNFNGKENDDIVTFTSKMQVPIYVLLGKRIEIESSSYRKKEKL